MTKNSNYWNEKWVKIGFETVENPPHYEVSNYGRLRSFQNDQKGGSIIRGSVIQGYRSLNIRVLGKTINNYVHKLVAAYFTNQETELHKYVIHLDFDKQNNRYQNLKWVTRDELKLHNRDNPAMINRRFPRRTDRYKLTASEVRTIKKMVLANKTRLRIIAKQFGITQTQLTRIRSGENWKNVTLKN